MKIAIAQLNYTVGAIEVNKSKIINSIHQAKAQGADLALFAEHAISGTKCYSLAKNGVFLEMCEDALVEIASHCDDISVVVGVPIRDGAETKSVAAVIKNRIIEGYIGKQRPSENEFIEVKGERVAVAVGENSLNEALYGGYAEIVVTIWESRYMGVRTIPTRYELGRSLSYTNGKTVVFVNHLGGQSDTIYDGSSCVYNKHGKPIALLNRFEEDFVVIDTQSQAEVEEPKHVGIEYQYRALQLGLRDYFEKNGFTKACLGLSGGIDSAVVLALLAEVLEPKNIKVLLMPSQFSSDHSVEDAIEMANNLGVEYSVIPIEPVYTSIQETMKPITGSTEFDVTEENIQARIRGMMLMALSNKFGHILLNTSNKSEAAMGYGTLYGDLAGSLSVLGDMYKSDVYALARYINRNGEIIPRNIIEKEPSAELRPNQKDSDSLPPYDVLDAILYRVVEKRQVRDEIVNAGFDDQVVSSVIRRLRGSEFKRRQSSPVLKISSRPFGEDGFVFPLLSKF